MYYFCFDRGLAGLFRDTGLTTFIYRRDLGRLELKIAGDGMRYTHGTGNVFIFYSINRQDIDQSYRT